MIAADQFLDLALACAVLIVVPGPSVMFVVGRALSYGRREAIASVAGNGCGCYAAAVGIAFGLGPVLQRSDALLTALKWCAAGYLVRLGMQAIRHAGVEASASVEGSPQSPWHLFRTGAVVGVTNPKTVIIFATIVPQFVNGSEGHVTAQMLQLAFAPIVVGLLTDSAWALGASGARKWLSGSPRRAKLVGRAGGVSIVGLGVSLAISDSSP